MSATATGRRTISFWDATAIVILGAAGCALSYDALRQIAHAIHVRSTLTYVFPVVIDGFIAYSVRALVLLRTAPLHARAYCWLLFGSATSASVWANALHAVRLNQQGPATGLRLSNLAVAILSSLAPLALAGAVHLYILITRHAQGADNAEAPRPGPDQSPSAARDHAPAAGLLPEQRGRVRDPAPEEELPAVGPAAEAGPAEATRMPAADPAPTAAAESGDDPVHQRAADGERHGPERREGDQRTETGHQLAPEPPGDGTARLADSTPGAAAEALQSAALDQRPDGAEQGSWPDGEEAGDPAGPARTADTDDDPVGGGPSQTGPDTPQAPASEPTTPEPTEDPPGDKPSAPDEAQSEDDPDAIRAVPGGRIVEAPLDDLLVIARQAAATEGRITRAVVAKAIRRRGYAVSNARLGEILDILQTGQSTPD